jgi:zinc transport system substrate-binding protein
MTTTGPHDFNPTEQDARLVSRADIMYTIGMGLDDHAAELMQKGSGNANLKIVPLSVSVPKHMRLESQCRHEHKAGEKHEHGDDPHLWLGPDHAVLMVNAIRDTLKEQDPAHAAGYDQRAAAYVTKLNGLKTYGLEKFKGKKDNRLVSFHDSLTYFAHTYNLEIRDILTQKPGQEPDAKEMRRLIRICADENKPTRVIAVEPQFSNSTSGETLKKELVAKGVKNPVLVEIDTLETVKPDELTLDWYEKRMRANIDALAAALE